MFVLGKEGGDKFVMVVSESIDVRNLSEAALRESSKFDSLIRLRKTRPAAWKAT